MPAPSTSDPDAPPRGWTPPLSLAAGAVLALHAAMVARFWWVTDDALISFRYARNLARGDGPRFNVWDQPPVEGYSNFLWVLLSAGVHALGLDMVRWMPVLSWLCGAALLVLLLHRLVRRLEVPFALATVAVGGLACYPPFAVWSTSGLETMAFALLLFLTFDRLALARGRPDAVLGGTFGALLALVRVEGVAWFVVVLVLALVGQALARRVALRPLLAAGGAVAVVVACHLAWRHAYYGELVANTVHAKSVSGPGFLERGVRYVLANVLTFVTPLVLVPGLVPALRPKRIATGIGVAALAWAFPVYGAVVSGDYMPMGRFLIPGLAFATVLFAWLLADLAGTSARRGRLALAAGVAVGVLGALPGWDVHAVPGEWRAWCRYRSRDAPDMDSEYARWDALAEKVDRWERRGRMLRAFAAAELEPPVTMVIRALGAIGYYTDFLMYDCAGLTVPEIARREVTEWKDQPGHDKAVSPYWFVDRRPKILRIWTFADDDPEAIAGHTREALDEPRHRKVQELYRPQLVRMVSTEGDETIYLLSLVQDEGATPRMWQSMQQIGASDVARVREIPY